uniref:cache domain-containing protein n=1 Tax=Clostridium sp. NkU-1 TaxID=1095009 RepID=UPI0032616D38
MELTEGTSTTQGVLLVDLSYSSLEHLFDGVTTGKGGYVYLISSDGQILYHPRSSSSTPGGCRRTIWWQPAIRTETTGRNFRGRPGSLR